MRGFLRRGAAFIFVGVVSVMAMGLASAEDTPITERVEHHFVDNDGVKIHYVSLGEGPLVVFIHGFPDYWYTWRHQMEGLSAQYRCVAMDTRGYNKSDQPEEQEAYDMELLISDVAAVIRDAGEETATVVGHDWGGGIAWAFAMARPEMCERLMICNLPHPRGYAREVENNPAQAQNRQYALNFMKPDSHLNLSAPALAMMVSGRDPEARANYQAAFERSSLNGMMNYYRQNYGDLSGISEEDPVVLVKMPVLLIHGLNDTALHHHALNNTWEWLEKDLTLVTIPGVGHWVQRDAADLVTRSMKMWLNR